MSSYEKMYHLVRLRQQWEKLNEQENVSKARNQQLLQDLDEFIESTDAQSRLIDRLTQEKDQFVSYVHRIFPLWLEAQKTKKRVEEIWSSTPKTTTKPLRFGEKENLTKIHSGDSETSYSLIAPKERKFGENTIQRLSTATHDIPSPGGTRQEIATQKDGQSVQPRIFDRRRNSAPASSRTTEQIERRRKLGVSGTTVTDNSMLASKPRPQTATNHRTAYEATQKTRTVLDDDDSLHEEHAAHPELHPRLSTDAATVPQLKRNENTPKETSDANKQLLENAHKTFNTVREDVLTLMQDSSVKNSNPNVPPRDEAQTETEVIADAATLGREEISRKLSVDARVAKEGEKKEHAQENVETSKELPSNEMQPLAVAKESTPDVASRERHAEKQNDVHSSNGNGQIAPKDAAPKSEKKNGSELDAGGGAGKMLPKNLSDSSDDEDSFFDQKVSALHTNADAYQALVGQNQFQTANEDSSSSDDNDIEKQMKGIINDSFPPNRSEHASPINQSKPPPEPAAEKLLLQSQPSAEGSANNETTVQENVQETSNNDRPTKAIQNVLNENQKKKLLTVIQFDVDSDSDIVQEAKDEAPSDRDDFSFYD